jgi:hypothetical protein
MEELGRFCILCSYTYLAAALPCTSLLARHDHTAAAGMTTLLTVIDRTCV